MCMGVKKGKAHTHVVFLIPVVLHQSDDAVVDEEGQSENTSELRTPDSELYTNPHTEIIDEQFKSVIQYLCSFLYLSNTKIAEQ